MDVGAHAQAPAVTNTMLAAQQIQTVQQEQVQRITTTVNASPEGQGNLGSAVMAAQALAAPVGQALRSDATAPRSSSVDSTKNVAGTGAAIASTADMAARAVVAPNPGGEAQNNLGHSDARERHLSTQAMVALKQRMAEGRLQGEDSGQDHPATELYDNARRRAADFDQNNPVFVATPPEIPAVEIQVSMYDSLDQKLSTP